MAEIDPEVRRALILELSELPRCKNSRCERPAEFRCHWPGQPTIACPEHKGAMEGIADVLGFELQSEALPDAVRMVEKIRDVVEDDASIRFSLLELD